MMRDLAVADDGAAISPGLRTFVAEVPAERQSILAFLRAAARETPKGARVMDAGAGDAPYRELFAHCEYVTVDWPKSPHTGAQASDIVASLEAIPVPDASFDAVVSTQVLEHLAEPAVVLGEMHRVLVPAGVLWLTAPFVWELHEEPHDYFRYTVHGLHHLVENAGFVEVQIAPRTGYFATMSILTRNCAQIVGSREDGRQRERRRIARKLYRLSRRLERLDDLDVRRALPLGYQCRAVRPSGR